MQQPYNKDNNGSYYPLLVVHESEGGYLNVCFRSDCSGTNFGVFMLQYLNKSALNS